MTAINTSENQVAGGEIGFTGVNKYFESSLRTTVALDDINFTIRPGEFVVLVGPSGCGKTTVMNIAAGLVTPSTGEALVSGHVPKLGDYDVGYLLARDSLQPWRTALRNVMLPLEIRGMKPKSAAPIAEEALDSVGLANARHKYPSELSHGMRQRVAVARTLAPNPKVILFDEPFSALDAQTRLTLQELFLDLWEKHKSTVMFITHDLSEAIALADRILVMNARPGRIIKEYPIDLERPRSVMELQGDAKYHDYYQEIWSIIKTGMSGQ